VVIVESSELRKFIIKWSLFGSLFYTIPALFFAVTMSDVKLLVLFQIGFWAIGLIPFSFTLGTVIKGTNPRIILKICLIFDIINVIFGLIALLLILRLTLIMLPILLFSMGIFSFALLAHSITSFTLRFVYNQKIHKKGLSTEITLVKKQSMFLFRWKRAILVYSIIMIVVTSSIIVGLDIRSNILDREKEQFRIANQSQHDAIDSLFSHKLVDFEGVTWHYIDEGNQSEYAKTLLLIHGIPEGWYSWRYVIPLLDQSYRIIAIDLKGYGRSIAKDDNFDYYVISEQLFDLMDYLNQSEFYFVTHDWGSVLGLCLAEQHPERISGWVRMAASIRPLRDDEKQNQLQFELFQSEFLGKLIMEDAEQFLDFVYGGDRMLSEYVAEDRTYLTFEYSRPGVAQDIQKYYETNNVAYIPRMMKILANPNRGFPLLILQADQDPAQPKSYFEDFSTHCPNATLMWITNSAHFCNFDQPNQVAIAINDFLAIHSSDST